MTRRSPHTGFPLCLSPACLALGPFRGWCGDHWRDRPQQQLDLGDEQ